MAMSYKGVIIILTALGGVGCLFAHEMHDLKAIHNAKSPYVIENVDINSQENGDSNKIIARKGVLVRHKDAVATIVLAHGYMCDKFDMGFLRNMFPHGKYNFLSFDFRAHGENTKGQHCTLGRDEAYDVIAAAKLVRMHPELKNKPVFLYAFSMGAVASIEAQAKDSSLFEAMILDCPFDSSETVVKNCLDHIKLSFFGYQFEVPGRTILQKYAFHPYVQSLIKTMLKAVALMQPRRVETNVFPFHPARSVAKISVPLFFIHCKSDEKVPVSAIKNLYASAGGPKMLWLTNGRYHYDSYFYNPELYVERVRSFLDQVMSGQWRNKNVQKVLEDGQDAEHIGELYAQR